MFNALETIPVVSSKLAPQLLNQPFIRSRIYLSCLLSDISASPIFLTRAEHGLQLFRETDPLYGHQFGRSLRTPLLIEDHSQASEDPPGLSSPEDARD